MSRHWAPAPLVAAATLTALTAMPAAATSNTSAPANWRLEAGSTFNGVVGAFDGTALLLFTTSGASGTYACSGSLMQGGQYVLTAAHCADGLVSMSVQFGYTNNTALQTRNAVSATINPGWNGTLDTGADLALIKLDAAVTNLPTYKLSTTNDVGKTYLMTGYGTSGTGRSFTSPNWNDGDYGHYGYNTFDTTSDVFTSAWQAATGDNVYTAPTYGLTYVSDFDAPRTVASASQYNTLQRIADISGGNWSNTSGLGRNEALIAGGDSGGGDFVWTGSEWVLSAVHSWGWQFCQGRIGTGAGDIVNAPGCDFRAANSSSYGDLSGSTAVFGHTAWINSVIAVPEPATYGLMALGLLAIGISARNKRPG